MVAMVAASFVVNAFRKHYYGVYRWPAIAVLFVMNIFPYSGPEAFLFRLSEQPANHALSDLQLFKAVD
jgi:hypothetical protein